MRAFETCSEWIDWVAKCCIFEKLFFSIELSKSSPFYPFNHKKYTERKMSYDLFMTYFLFHLL
jgi:hypothetical protein